MDRTVVGVGLAVLGASLLVVLPVMAQQSDEPTTDIETQLRELQMQRCKVLNELVERQSVMYRVGECRIGPVLAAQRDLFQASLEVADSLDRRMAVLESHAEIAKRTHQAAQDLHNAGEVQKTDPLQAKAALLEIEIELLRERAKQKSRSK